MVNSIQNNAATQDAPKRIVGLCWKLRKLPLISKARSRPTATHRTMFVQTASLNHWAREAKLGVV